MSFGLGISISAWKTAYSPIPRQVIALQPDFHILRDEASFYQILISGGEFGGGEQVGSASGSRPAEPGSEEWAGFWRAARDLASFSAVL